MSKQAQAHMLMCFLLSLGLKRDLHIIQGARAIRRLRASRQGKATRLQDARPATRCTVKDVLDWHSTACKSNGKSVRKNRQKRKNERDLDTCTVKYNTQYHNTQHNNTTCTTRPSIFFLFLGFIHVPCVFEPPDP